MKLDRVKLVTIDNRIRKLQDFARPYPYDKQKAFIVLSTQKMSIARGKGDEFDFQFLQDLQPIEIIELLSAGAEVVDLMICTDAVSGKKFALFGYETEVIGSIGEEEQPKQQDPAPKAPVAKEPKAPKAKAKSKKQLEIEAAVAAALAAAGHDAPSVPTISAEPQQQPIKDFAAQVEKALKKRA